GLAVSHVPLPRNRSSFLPHTDLGNIDEQAVIAPLMAAGSARVAAEPSVILTGCGAVLNPLFRHRRGPTLERLMAGQWHGRRLSSSSSPAGSKVQPA
ncbi:MAG TPA: hypothetical protein QGF27_16825, partial [Arenicellales bacterium]|nr:hypothetical protein [Arenicellales bacterium]